MSMDDGDYVRAEPENYWICLSPRGITQGHDTPLVRIDKNALEK